MHALMHTESKLLHFIYVNTKYKKRKSVFIHICLCLVCINACMDLHENLCVDQYICGGGTIFTYFGGSVDETQIIWGGGGLVEFHSDMGGSAFL